jgi:hypothetical protein
MIAAEAAMTQSIIAGEKFIFIITVPKYFLLI